MATISDRAAFRPLWRPPFISALVTEDRCHLNGFAMDNGVPAFVTAVSASDVQDGWRDRRRDGSVVVHVESGQFVARGLSFFGRFAVVAPSRPRHNQTIEGLALQYALKTRDAEPRCGLVVVDIETGRTLHWLRFEHKIDELYDVALLPGVRQAEALGFQGDDLAGAAVEPEVP